MHQQLPQTVNFSIYNLILKHQMDIMECTILNSWLVAKISHYHSGFQLPSIQSVSLQINAQIAMYPKN